MWITKTYRYAVDNSIAEEATYFDSTIRLSINVLKLAHFVG